MSDPVAGIICREACSYHSLPSLVGRCDPVLHIEPHTHSGKGRYRQQGCRRCDLLHSVTDGAIVQGVEMDLVHVEIPRAQPLEIRRQSVAGSDAGHASARSSSDRRQSRTCTHHLWWSLRSSWYSTARCARCTVVEVEPGGVRACVDGAARHVTLQQTVVAANLEFHACFLEFQTVFQLAQKSRKTPRVMT